MGLMMKGNALVTEDNPETRSWLEECIGEAFPDMVIRSSGDFSGAVDLIRNHPFSLALIDLGLPDGSGTDMIPLLRVKNPDCHIIVATIYDDDKNLFSALKAGAQGYILKDQDMHRIIGYLKGLKQNQPALSPATSRRLVNHFNHQGMELSEVGLTPRETDTMRLISKGFTIEETAKTLSISNETVRSYLKSVYSKLQVNNRAELTLSAVRLGLIE